MHGETKAVTIFNLLELCGILAAAMRKQDSEMVLHKYLDAEDIAVIFPPLLPQLERDFWASLVSECFSRIQRGLRLRDASILWALETNDNIDTIVIWNTKHFIGKTPLKVLTPMGVQTV